jgi:hypothetical protein
MLSLSINFPHFILFEYLDLKGMKRQDGGGNRIMRSCTVHTKFWLESLKERDHSEDLGIGG